MWDTAGQERFRAITSAYYRSADGLLLCYDITNKTSFENLNSWIGEIRKHTQNFVMLVGCKLDIVTETPSKRQVKTSQAQTFAHQHGLQYIEVSVELKIYCVYSESLYVFHFMYKYKYLHRQNLQRMWIICFLRQLILSWKQFYLTIIHLMVLQILYRLIQNYLKKQGKGNVVNDIILDELRI